MSAFFSCLDPLDRSVFFMFQKIQSAFLDNALGFPTVLGETVFLISIVMVAVFFLDRANPMEKSARAVFSILTAHWSVSFLKDFFARPRPYEVWPHAALTFGKTYGMAFPSGHAAVAFAAAHTLNIVYHGKISWGYAIAAWVGITRIYTGIHYPSDVLAGALVGILCGEMTDRLFKQRGITA